MKGLEALAPRRVCSWLAQLAGRRRGVDTSAGGAGCTGVVLTWGLLPHAAAVVNAPTANTVAAAEHGIALLCALARNVPQVGACRRRLAPGWPFRQPGVLPPGLALALAHSARLGARLSARPRLPCRMRPALLRLASPQPHPRCTPPVSSLQADAAMKGGRWERSKWVGVSMVGKTLAVMGFGKVGSEVARRAKGERVAAVLVQPVPPARCCAPGYPCLPLLWPRVVASLVVAVVAPTGPTPGPTTSHAPPLPCRPFLPCAGLGMAVVAYDPYASQEKAAALGVKLVTLDEALAQVGGAGSTIATVPLPWGAGVLQPALGSSGCVTPSWGQQHAGRGRLPRWPTPSPW